MRNIPRFSLAAGSRNPATARVKISITNNNPVMFVPSMHFDARNVIHNHRSVFFFIYFRIPMIRD